MKASTNGIKRTVALVLLLLVGAVIVTPQAERQEGQEAAAAKKDKNERTPRLPEGPGRALLVRACVQCHDLQLVISHRETAAAWRRTVDEMIQLGAQLKDDEAEVVATYLATWFGPEAEIRHRPSEALPEGQGRDLVFQACMQCHDLKNIVSQRKTAAAWRRTVNVMIWRGAPLMADEAEVVVKYLATSFGLNGSTPSVRK